MEINKTDLKILYDLYFSEPCISELTKRLGIAQVNTWKHLKKLKKLGLIIIKNYGVGNKKIIIKNYPDDFKLIEFIEKWNQMVI